MSTTQVSVTDLNRVVGAIAATQAAVQQITARTNQISNQVEAVDHRVAAVNRDLVALAKDFAAFVKEQRNANNFQRALTEIVRVRQELDQKFGKHAEARKRLQGILDTVDTGLLREFTIASCSEQIMLDTPKYWLSPCLVALAAWISNNKDLANRAVKVALDRDVERTALLLALVSRRTIPADPDKINKEREKNKEQKLSAAEAAELKRISEERQTACFQWLDDYFSCQDPMDMKESVIVLIDSWANNIFGNDEKKICQNTFTNWMNTVAAGGINKIKVATDDNLSQDAKKQLLEQAEATTKAFTSKQENEWLTYFNRYNEGKSTKQQYPILAEVSPEFPTADAYLIRINEKPRIKNYFNEILKTQIDAADLIDRLDEQLETLINNFDPEEEILRKEEEHYELVKKFEGDNDKVIIEEQKRARPKGSAKANLVERLSGVLRLHTAEDKKKFAAARKTALRSDFLGKYISVAYEKYGKNEGEAFPKEINLRHASWKGWTGKSVDGRNTEELTKSYTEHMNRCRDQELAAVPTSKVKSSIILSIILAIIGVIGFVISQPIVGAIGLILTLVFIIVAAKANAAVKAAKEKIVALYKDLIEVGIKTITAALSQWVAVLMKVAEFKNNAVIQVLDLDQMARDANKNNVDNATAETEDLSDVSELGIDSPEYSLDALEADESAKPAEDADSLDALEAQVESAKPAEGAEQMVQAQESKPQTTLNQSAEFLQQFASNFSPAFVLVKPANYDILKAKAAQDAKALKNK